MKYFLLLPSLLMTCYSNPIFGQKGFGESDLDRSNIKGKVIAIKQEIFEAKYDGEKNVISGSKLDDPTSNWTKKYNEEGTLIEKKCLDINGNLTYSLKCEYDKSGNRTEEKEVNTDGSVHGKSLYKYSSAGECIEENDYDGKGALSSRITWRVDSFGFSTQQLDYDGSGNLINKHVLTNNLFGKLVEESSYNGKGSLEYKFTFSYDIDGNRMLQYAYYPDGKLKNVIQFSYVYDDWGNWIEKVKSVNGNLKSITKRQITYAANNPVFVAGHLAQKSDLELGGLNGSIAKIKQEEYFAKYETGYASSPVIRTSLSDDKRQNYVLSYNSRGNKQTGSQHAGNSKSFTKLSFSYASNGNLIESRETNENTNQITYREIYKYDGENMTEKQVTYYSDGDSSKYKYSYMYDEVGNAVLEMCSTLSDSLLNGIFYKYDKQGYLIEEDHLNTYGAVKSIVTNKYDASGRLIETWSTDNDSRRITTYTYDDHGNITEELATRVNNDGTKMILLRKRMEYEYDSKGNWTKKTVFENWKPTYIVLRSFVYN